MRGLFQGLSSVTIRRSALAPFLFACLFITVPSYIIAAMSSAPLSFLILGLGSLPVIFLGIASLTLLFKDPDRLHTEEHLERKQAMEIVESKGEGVLLNDVDLVNMVNPSPVSKKLSMQVDREEDSHE